MNRQQRRSTQTNPQAPAQTGLFQQAVALHQAGRVFEAEQLYRRLLAADPNEIATLGNLGVALMGQQRLDEAIAMLRRALALKPDFGQAALNLAMALRASGATAEALAAYQRAATLVPPTARMHNDIAVVLAGLGRMPEALAGFRAAIALEPDYAEGHANLGRALLEGGAVAEGVAALREAVAQQPGSADLLSDLGVALMRAGDLDGAVAVCREALTHQPDFLSAHVNLAAALQDQGFIQESLDIYNKIVVQAPDHAGIHSSMASAHWKLGDPVLAAEAARHAVTLDPTHINGWFNLGSALLQLGDVDGSIAAQQQALAIDPKFGPAELKIAHALLGRGDFARGWAHLESRWRSGEKVSNFDHLIDQPRWQGEPLEGRTILLHYEQGLGDTIQLLRFVPKVVESGGDVLLIVHPPLQSLVPEMKGVRHIVDLAELPAFDVHCSLFSLPLALGTRVATIPAAIPYLHADRAAVARWRRRLDGADGLRVGLVWSGNASHKGDVYRSIQLPMLAPLLGVPGVDLFSLQHDLRAGDAEWLAGPGARITRLDADLTDFGETAAALAALDLLISVDTSVVHLAGAMGLPAWLLLWQAPEWRWAIDRDRSSWYPSVRLMRQPGLDDWQGLIAQVAAELAERADTKPTVAARAMAAV